MAGLPEQPQWEADIYQIETTDPVVGGPPDLAQGQGITNVPHQLLANRTAYLKAQIETLITNLDGYTTDAELAAAIANFVTQADIDAAIDNLVNGAPAALDTLQELATALHGNDSEIAALVAQIAGKLDATEYTAEDILNKLKTVDGEGSGLDADTLDGQSSSSFVRTTRQVNAGTGLTGGGSLFSDKTIAADIATLSEALAGVISTKLMTPWHTKEAIKANAPGLLIVQDRKANGTEAQALTGGAWTHRDLNSVTENTISGASLAANSVTLPAGSYRVEADVPAFRVNGNIARLYNVTDAATVEYGSLVNSHQTGYASSISRIVAEFTLSAPKALRIEHLAGTTNSAGGGDGRSLSGYLGPHIFTQMKIEKVL